MRLAGLTDVGKVRANNEDCYAFLSLAADASLAIVCDGMGGIEGGEIASSIAVETIQKKVEIAFSPKMKPAAMERMLVAAITAANYQIFDYALKHDLVGMGTTVVAAIIKDDCYIIAYDGDSRAYLLNDSIRQITSDHTYLNELYRMGKITLEEMQTDPRKNIITRALGVSEEIDVDTLIDDFGTGDTLLLCSDGLTNCLSDAQILEIFQTQQFETIPQVLIDKANENGGTDNITAALIQYGEA